MAMRGSGFEADVGDRTRQPPTVSDVRLFRDLERVIYFNAQVANRAFDLGVTQQQLDSTQVLCPAIDHRRFRAPQRMRAIHGRVEPDIR